MAATIQVGKNPILEKTEECLFTINPPISLARSFSPCQTGEPAVNVLQKMSAAKLKEIHSTAFLVALEAQHSNHGWVFLYLLSFLQKVGF